MEIIDSTQNARVKGWAKLHQKKERDKTGLFIVEGEHLVEEALRHNAVKTILFVEQCPFEFKEIIKVNKPIMDKLSSNPSGASIIAICRQNQLEPTQEHNLVLLDDIQDPGNLGTIIRTAVSFGVDGIYCSKGTCDLYNDKVIRSTQGAIFGIPVIRCDLEEKVKEFQDKGICVIATTLEKAKPMQEFQDKKDYAIILGNEGQGVHHSLQEIADERLRIEMSGFESLNVAVAGGIIMYHFWGK